MKHLSQLGLFVIAITAFIAFASGTSSACEFTGYNGLTAVLVNPATVTGDVNAASCDIGVYFDGGHSGTVKKANIHGALYYGVFANGGAGAVTVDVLSSTIHDIGYSPLNGIQRGVAIYFRAYSDAGSVDGKISGNNIYNYQKGGIVTNGPGVQAIVSNNTVTGQGPVSYIAQNGIQIGYGANASVMQNNVSGNQYTGATTVSGGIVVVGGPGYGTCPGGGPCAYTVNTRINNNTVSNNDVGIFLTNVDADGNAPATATNLKAVNNIVTNDALTNSYFDSRFPPVGYQAGISDVGNNDKIISNTVSGAGYDANANPNAFTVFIDADISFTNRPKVHANK